MPKRATVDEAAVPFLDLEERDSVHPVERFADNGALDRIINIPIDRIRPGSAQPRKRFDRGGIEELAQSIKQHGLIQPIVVTKSDEGFCLVAGERRFRACQVAGIKKIKATVTAGDPLEIGLIENVQREDLSPIEEADGYRRLIEMHHYTQSEVAQIVGKSQPYINKALALTVLPEGIKSDYSTSNKPISREQLYQITREKTPEQMHELYDQIRTHGLTVRQVRETQRKQGPKARPENVLVQSIQRLDHRLAKIELTKLETNDRAELTQSLEGLRARISVVIKSLK